MLSLSERPKQLAALNHLSHRIGESARKSAPKMTDTDANRVRLVCLDGNFFGSARKRRNHGNWGAKPPTILC